MKIILAYINTIYDVCTYVYMIQIYYDNSNTVYTLHKLAKVGTGPSKFTQPYRIFVRT